MLIRQLRLLLVTCCALVGLLNPAGATESIKRWRHHADAIRTLAENEVPLAYSEALQLEKNLPPDASPADRARLLNLLSRIEIYLAQTAASKDHAVQALTLANQSGDRIGQSEANLNIVLIAINQGRIDEAASATVDALRALDGVNRPDLMAEAMARTSTMYQRSGQTDASVTTAMQAMDMARQSNDPLALTLAYRSMALAYELSGRPNEALEHYTKMRKFAHQAHSSLLEATALRGMATTYSNQGNLPLAESAIRTSTDIFRRAGTPFNVNFGLFTLADILNKQGRTEDAVKAQSQAIETYRRYPNPIGLWWTLTTRCDYLLSLGRPSAAAKDAEESYALAKQIDMPLYLSGSSRRLAAVAASQNDYRRAYELSLQAESSVEKTVQRKAGERMVELAERYKSEAKQRKIDELNRQNEQQIAERRWLRTVFAASLLLLGISTYFLLRQRHAQRQLAALNSQLKQSRNKLQATLDAIPDPLFELGLDGRYFNVRSPLGDLLAAPADHLIGRTVVECLPPAAATTCLEALREAHETGTSFGKQIALNMDQRTRWFELSVARKSVSRDRNPLFIVLSRDITERKHFETQDKIRLKIFELQVQGGPLEQVLDLVIHYVEDERPELICGIMLADAEGKYLHSACSPRLSIDYQAFIAIIPIAENSGSCGTAAWRRKTVIVEDIDTNPSWTAYRTAALEAGLRACWSEPIVGATGNILGTFCIYRQEPAAPTKADRELMHQASRLAAIAIERTRMESALAASEREFRTLAENAPDNIVRFDRHGRLLYANPSLLGTLDSEIQHLVGKTPLEAYPDGRYQDLQTCVEEVVASGAEKQIEITRPAQGNDEYYYHFRFVPEHANTGEVIGVLAIGQNITDNKKKERQIKESRDMLRELAARRDSAREEERKRIAREIHDELGQMLTAQRLDIATLKFQFGKANPMLDERCQHLIEISDQTIRVVRNVATALRPAAIDMGIGASLSWLATEFHNRTRISCRLTLNEDELFLDEEQALALFRIVQESLTNIARHAEAQHVDICLKAFGNRYHLLVSDNGKGFDANELRTKSFGLVGIHERALIIGGEANVISAPGRGTTIEIRIPNNQTGRTAHS